MTQTKKRQPRKTRAKQAPNTALPERMTVRLKNNFFFQDGKKMAGSVVEVSAPRAVAMLNEGKAELVK